MSARSAGGLALPCGNLGRESRAVQCVARKVQNAARRLRPLAHCKPCFDACGKAGVFAGCAKENCNPPKKYCSRSGRADASGARPLSSARLGLRSARPSVERRKPLLAAGKSSARSRSATTDSGCGLGARKPLLVCLRDLGVLRKAEPRFHFWAMDLRGKVFLAQARARGSTCR